MKGWQLSCGFLWIDLFHLTFCLCEIEPSKGEMQRVANSWSDLDQTKQTLGVKMPRETKNNMQTLLDYGKKLDHFYKSSFFFKIYVCLFFFKCKCNNNYHIINLLPRYYCTLTFWYWHIFRPEWGRDFCDRKVDGWTDAASAGIVLEHSCKEATELKDKNLWFTGPSVFWPWLVGASFWIVTEIMSSPLQYQLKWFLQRLTGLTRRDTTKSSAIRREPQAKAQLLWGEGS